MLRQFAIGLVTAALCVVTNHLPAQAQSASASGNARRRGRFACTGSRRTGPQLHRLGPSSHRIGAPGHRAQPADRRPPGQGRHLRHARRTTGGIRSPQPAESGARSRVGVPRHPRANQQETRRTAWRARAMRDTQLKQAENDAKIAALGVIGNDLVAKTVAEKNVQIPRGGARARWHSCGRPSSCRTTRGSGRSAHLSRFSATARRTPGNMRSATPRRCGSSPRTTASSC